MRALILALVFVLVAGCSATPSRPDAAAATAPATFDGRIEGRILLPPGASLAEGARLQLSLVDRFSSETDSAPLARTEHPISGPAPLEFNLPFARSSVRDISVYRLDVAIYDADGRLVFVSDGEHPVNLGVEAEPTRIELMQVSLGAPQRSVYDCGEELVEAVIRDPELRLQLTAATHLLRRAHAASGLRYIGAEAEFWSLGEEARIQLGTRELDCRRVSAS